MVSSGIVGYLFDVYCIAITGHYLFVSVKDMLLFLVLCCCF